MEENETHIEHSQSMSDIVQNVKKFRVIFFLTPVETPHRMCGIRWFQSIEINLQSRRRKSPPWPRWMENSQIQATLKQSSKAYETSFTRWKSRSSRVTPTLVSLPVTATIPWRNNEGCRTSWLVFHLVLPQLLTPTAVFRHQFYGKLRLSTAGVLVPCQRQSRTTQHP